MSTTNSAIDIAVAIVTAAATGGVAIADFAFPLGYLALSVASLVVAVTSAT